MNIPFSPYDFFGYLADGFVLLCAIEFAFLGTSLPGKEWKVGTTVFYIVLADMIGHLIANISSFLLEHLIVRKWLRSSEETLFEPQRQSWRSFFFPIFRRPFTEQTQKRHKRSNVESTFSAIERNFGDSVCSKCDYAMVNEVLCKILCHKICCLIQEQCELGIEPIFWNDEQRKSRDLLPINHLNVQ